MTILTIPQLELLVFLESSMIPEWFLRSPGGGLGDKSYGYKSVDGSGYGVGNTEYGIGYINGSGAEYS